MGYIRYRRSSEGTVKMTSLGEHIEAARKVGDWETHAKLWEERRMAEVDRDEMSIKPAQGPAFVVLSDSREVDQIVGTEREARREVKDLKAMGCDNAKWKRFETWQEAEAFEDKIRAI